jgi:hypothetical protein
MIDVLEHTWAAAEVDGVDVLFYYGGPSLRLEGRHLDLPVEEKLPAGEKTLAAFEYVLANHDFDVLFRTNTSSYVDLANLRAYLEARARPQRFYAGVLGHQYGIDFASGSGYFLSRDLVELVVEHADEWNHRRHDDCALAGVLHARGIQPEPAPRVDYESLRVVWRVDTSQFHFRCRAHSADRNQDIRMIYRVHNAFLRARVRPSRRRNVYEALVGPVAIGSYRLVRWTRARVGRTLRKLPGGDTLVNRIRGGPPTFPYNSG